MLVAALSTGLKDKGPFCGSLLWVITRTISFAWQLNLLELGAVKVSFLPWANREPWVPHGWTDSGRVQAWQRPNCELYSVCPHYTQPQPAHPLKYQWQNHVYSEQLASVMPELIPSLVGADDKMSEE